MTQIGESVSVPQAIKGGKEECIFCGKKHQDEKEAPAHTFQRSSDGMKKLKSEGRSMASGLGRTAPYPGTNRAPLVEWEKDINKTGGYKAAAHHCIALKTVSEHKISGELNEAGYDPNHGTNCIWLPYSRLQFIRARAYDRGLQKHSGGHTEQYFKTVKKHIDNIADNVSKKFCANGQKVNKNKIIRYMALQENSIWRGVKNANIAAYQLYNDAFLDPNLPWGSYEEEKGLTGKEYLGLDKSSAMIDDDLSAEKINELDPE